MQKPLLLLLLLALLSSSSFTPAPRPGGKDYALFIAVEQYDNTGAWKKLPDLIQECKDIRNDLVTRYGFSEESKVLENPGLSEIKDELDRWRRRKFGKDDQLLVFFSGHGKFLDHLQEGYFIPSDGDPGSAPNAEGGWYSLLQLPRHVTTIPCRHILLAIDACYSGSVFPNTTTKSDSIWERSTKKEIAEFDQFVHDLLANQSRILMTSAGKDRSKHPSDFARFFREALATLGGNDHILYGHEIENYWPVGDQRPRSGYFEGHEPGGNFLFVYEPQGSHSKENRKQQTLQLTIDYDKDGIPDDQDACPTEIGLASTKGCPDADGDGVADKFDKCSDVFGPISNNGCPDLIDPMAEDMVLVKGGVFLMGNDSTDHKQAHQVEVSTFFISRFEVTVHQYLLFCEATNTHWPAWLEAGNKVNIETGTDPYYKNQGMIRGNKYLPVMGINWDDAVAFCKWLSIKSGKVYRLPTEAEWEYAARGGAQSKGFTYAGSYDLKKVSWHPENATGRVHPVGGLLPNELGLYDMSGNLREWCSDWFNAYEITAQPIKDPLGAPSGLQRVCRGGAWSFTESAHRTTKRGAAYATARDNSMGFRVVREK